MNLSSWIVLLLIAAVVIADVIYLMRTGLDSCSGSCSDCHGSCRWARDIKKARRSIERARKIRAFLHLD
ncbi:MAG: hypothetical protein K6A40_02940 [Solobacterium sp.]|nr:hypothetical protein [Solobacterium sp.]